MPAGGTSPVRGEPQRQSEGALAAGDYVVMGVSDAGCGIPADIIDQSASRPHRPRTSARGPASASAWSMVSPSNRAAPWAAQRSRSGPLAPIVAAALYGGGRPAGRRRAGQPDASRAAAKLRVLLIDDHPEVRQTTAAMLRDLGRDASRWRKWVPKRSNAARSGTAVRSPHQRIMQCPRQSGTEVGPLAREVCPQLPAVIITGHAVDGRGDRRPPGRRRSAHEAVHPRRVFRGRGPRV